MPDLAVLESHFRDTSGTLFACAARILGDGSEAVDHVAEHAGLAQGVTRILARMPYDAARSQLYLPHDMLRQNGGSEHEFYAGKLTLAIRATLDQLITGAQEQLAVADGMLPDVAAPARAAFLPMALVKYDLAQMVVADPFELYIRSRLRTLWTLWRAS